MIRRPAIALVAVLALAACKGKQTEPLTIRTAEVSRRTIVVQAEATGVIEPINVVEVKSRASGQVTQMPVETGTLVRPGDLIVQLDTRDVQNQFNQAKADLEAAEKKLEVSAIQKKRSDELLAARIITAQENEAAQLDYANAQSAIVRARASLDLAQQRLDDARVTAPVTGTIIEKPVALGQVIQSGTSAVGGGTTIVKMADLTRVRARALVNETDIGSVRAGLEATVIVDAFPDRPFRGTVEKIEPQAIVQQNVTMFPVLVTLDNQEGLLMPGMNGEVSIVSERRDEVIAVSNDAVRSVREAAQAAGALGLNPDSVQAQLRAGMGGGFGGGAGGGRGPTGSGAGAPTSTGGPTGGAPQGRAAAAGGPTTATATAPECAALEAARRAKPAAAKKLDDLTTKMRAPDADRRAIMGEMRAVYDELGIDAQTARGCRQSGGNGGGPSSGRQASGGTPAGGMGAGGPGGASGGRRAGTRSGLVFVQKADSTWEPRVVRLGVSDYDYTEVVSGLQPGEKVALLSAALLQAQREQSNDRFRAMTGGGSPLGGGTGGGAPGGAGGGGRPGGAGGGGGGAR